MNITWKSFIRITWLPNALLFMLIAWLIATDQGLFPSQPQRNAENLLRIEKQLETMKQETAARRRDFDFWKKHIEQEQSTTKRKESLTPVP